MKVKNIRKCFIRSTGKQETQIFQLIDYVTFNLIDMFFSTELDAIKYADKNSIEIVQYDEDK